jgi:hypothetical protein
MLGAESFLVEVGVGSMAERRRVSAEELSGVIPIPIPKGLQGEPLTVAIVPAGPSGEYHLHGFRLD